jgi:hypothetical protein
MLLKGFEKLEADEECYMTTSKVVSYLQASTLVKLSEKQMDEPLRKAEFEWLSKRLMKGANIVQCYWIKKLSRIHSSTMIYRNMDYFSYDLTAIIYNPMKKG